MKQLKSIADIEGKIISSVEASSDYFFLVFDDSYAVISNKQAVVNGGQGKGSITLMEDDIRLPSQMDKKALYSGFTFANSLEDLKL